MVNRVIKWVEDAVLWRRTKQTRIEDINTAAGALISNIEGYEGDYSLHVFNESMRLVLAVRNADGEVVVFDCRIERLGKLEKETQKPGAAPVRIPKRDWF
jgi:hypothetical protein